LKDIEQSTAQKSMTFNSSSLREFQIGSWPTAHAMTS
jgi:hypothetical protein